jgi:CubicO group peptidase (beta-lactamase class C family)
MNRMLCVIVTMSTSSVLAEGLRGAWQGEAPFDSSSVVLRVESFADAAECSVQVSLPAAKIRRARTAELACTANSIRFRLTEVPGQCLVELTLQRQNPSGVLICKERNKSFSLEPVSTSADLAQAALKDFESVVAPLQKDWKVPGVGIAAVVGDTPIFVKGFGFRDLEKKLPVTADTLFVIASSTKPFTSYLLASYVDEGALSWEAPVRNYIPWFSLNDRFAAERMTARDLLTHRSGLPRHDGMWYGSSLSREALVRRLPFLLPNKDFRTDFQYNNLMFVTAGHLAEVLGKKSWEQLTRERIFAPLGMKRANFSVAVSAKDADHAEAYREEKDGSLKKIPLRNVDNIGPAGSINASLNDLVPWLSLHVNGGALRGKRYISKDTLATLHRPVMTMGPTGETPEVVPGGYALGWFTEVYRGFQIVHHGGNLDGMSSMVVLVPELKLGIAVLSNLESSTLRDILPRYLIDRLATLEPRDWSSFELAKKLALRKASLEGEAKKQGLRKPNTTPSHALSDFVGEYEHPGYGVLKVALEKDGKALQFAYNQISTPLEHWHYDVFSGRRNEADPAFENEKLRFVSDWDGEVSAVETAFEPSVAEIRFMRRPDSKLTDPQFLKTLSGNYTMAGREVTVSLKGSTLFFSVAGQRAFELLPKSNNRFDLKELTGVYARFVIDAASGTTMELVYPDTVLVAKKR